MNRKIKRTSLRLAAKRTWRLASLVLIAGVLFCASNAAEGAILTVMNGGDSGLGTLRQAILDATSGDTINFAASITTINLTSGELLINKNLTINGPGPNLLTVQRSSGMFFRIFDIASASITATISGLTITSGRAFNSNGGGISNVGALTITNCAISANTTDSFGGGIYNAGLLTITASTISANVTGSPEIQQHYFRQLGTLNRRHLQRWRRHHDGHRQYHLRQRLRPRQLGRRRGHY
jgi:hypothetical protein